MFMGLDR